MASSSITSRQIDGERREAVRDFILWDSKITADDVCSLMLTPWKESFDQPRQHLKSRDTTLPTKVHLGKSMVFPVAMYGCQSWTIKKDEHWRTDAFELWCWRRLLRVPWTARRSNQSIPKEISPEYYLEGLMLKLIFPYFGHLMQRNGSSEKTLMLGKIEGKRRKGQVYEMLGWHHWLHGNEFEQTLEVGNGQEGLACYSLLGCRVGQTE